MIDEQFNPVLQFKCDLCGGIFDKIRDETWSEEKAIEEAKQIFGYYDKGFAVVCDDCWEEIKPD